MSSYEFTLSGGRPAFRKFSFSGRGDQFEAEALGLRALADTGTVRTPEVLSVSDTELLTERIQTGPATRGSWEQLGEQLAALHGLPQPCFGFTGDNYCGATPQPNDRTEDGYQFYARQRFQFQGRLARDAGLLQTAESEMLESLCRRLPELVPAQGPSLLHGDLWNGNVLFDQAGEPVVIDPACYWGWPEAEIAMCALFGGFPETFYASWEAAAKPAPGWRDRLPVYQLYHVLNHLNLFGLSYHGQAVAIIRRFA